MKIRILQGVLVLILSACAIFLGVAVQQAVYHWEEEVPQEQPDLGGVNSVAGIRYFLHGSGVSATDSSITLTSFKQPVNQYPLSMTDFGDIAYLTLEPGNTTRQEFISFTGVTQNSDGTATLTGVTRGLSFVSPYTASSTIRKAHPGGSDAVISNPPQFYERFINTFNSATSSGEHVWSSTTPPRYDVDPANHRAGTYVSTTSEFASVRFVLATGAGANVSATEAVRGEVELATQLEMSSSTATGGTGASLILQSRYATSSPSAVCGRCTPITGNNGKLSQSFFDLTQAFTWTAHHIFSTLFATNASTTNATTTSFAITGSAFHINGINFRYPSTQGASSTALATNGSGQLAWVPMQDYAGGVYASTTLSTATGHSFTITHGLGTVPKAIKIDMYCIKTSANADIGESHGFATSTASQYVIFSTQGDVTADISTDSALIVYCNMTDGNRRYALSAIDTTTFTLTLTGSTPVANEMNLLWMAYK